MNEGYRESGAEDRSVLVVAFGARVFGLSSSDGTLRWEHSLETGLGPDEVEILIEHGRVYATTGWELHCLDYASGQLIGKVSVPDKYKGRPSMVIERDRIYLGSGGEVTCFTTEGRPLWVQGFAGKGTGRVALGFPGNIRQADDVGRQ